MWKLVTSIIFSLLFLFSSTTYADDLTTTPIFIDGQIQNLDQSAVTQNGQTLVPIGLLATALGIQVDWDGGNKNVYIETPAKTINIKIGSSVAYTLNDDSTSSIEILDTAPILINNYTMIPIQYISKWLGDSVEWKGGSAYISTGAEN